jgi:hypothetical protein
MSPKERVLVWLLITAAVVSFIGLALGVTAMWWAVVR